MDRRARDGSERTWRWPRERPPPATARRAGQGIRARRLRRLRSSARRIGARGVRRPRRRVSAEPDAIARNAFALGNPELLDPEEPAVSAHPLEANALVNDDVGLRLIEPDCRSVVDHHLV